ncbi:hypothetical protein AGMMS49959_00880 [Planctomycetales bacterium]|nr:hypothetical protein AGMMS49959_00880 [Planctomycetales bacterium]
MEMLSSLHFWQWTVVVAVGVFAFAASAKNRIVPAKLAVMFGLTALVLLQMFKTAAPKETLLDAGIRQLAAKLETDALRPDMPPQFASTIEPLVALNLKPDHGGDAATPLLADLEKYQYPADYLKARVDELVRAWKTRAESSLPALKAQLAALKKIDRPTPEQQAEIAKLNAVIPAWYDNLPLKFGLDLRGGTEMQLRLRPDTARLEKLQHDLAERQAAGVTDGVAALDEEIKTEREALAENFRNAANVIRNRLNASGLEEISVTVQGGDKLLVQIPGMSADGAQSIIDRVKRMGQLEFRIAMEGVDNELVHEIKNLAADNPRDLRNYSRAAHRFLDENEVSIDRNGRRRGTGGEELYDYLHTDDGTAMVISQEIELTGDYISTARAAPDAEHPGNYMISFTLTPRGSFLFENITRNNLKRGLAIILDGKLKSAPTIQSVISHSGQITGNFSREEAESLEVILKDSLKTQVEVEFENTVGPSLGEDNIRQSIVAVVAGIALVLIFMLIYYRVAGVISDLVLSINFLFIVGLLSAFDATLTLPGIAGLVLTVGMAIDANILIFERIREELGRGNTLPRAIKLGYERAFVTIIDANITTLIVAVILDQFGTEAVRGFAKTLIVGTVCSVFTSVVLTRWCFDALLAWGWLRELKMAQFFTSPNIQFVKVRRYAFAVSAVCIIAGMALFAARGNKNLAQDFTGGVLAQISLTQPLTLAEARAKATDISRDLDVQRFGEPVDGKYGEFIVRTSRIKDDANPDLDGAYTVAELRQKLAAHFALQPNGLTVGAERVAAKSTPEVAVFAAKISLTTPLAAAELNKTLTANTVLKNIEVTDGANGELQIFAGLPLLAPDGTQRGDADVAALVRDQLQRLRDLGILQFTEPFPRFSTVGPAAADEMIVSAIGALVFALIVISAYIWLRFQFRLTFGIAAIVGLAHDVLFCLGALALVDYLGLLNGQISLVVVAGLLTMVGYSINDTIVVFDRIRENMRLTSGVSMPTLINDAINQTLTRTVVTSASTLLVVVILLFLGGEALRGFSFVLFVGILVGTYSSIFVVAPVLVEWALRQERNKERQAQARMELAKKA